MWLVISLPKSAFFYHEYIDCIFIILIYSIWSCNYGSFARGIRIYLYQNKNRNDRKSFEKRKFIHDTVVHSLFVDNVIGYFFVLQ